MSSLIKKSPKNLFNDVGTKNTVLRQLLSEINISDSLQEHWQYLEHRDLELIECRLIRIFPKSTEKFLLLYELELKSAEKIFTEQLFAEWFGEHAMDRFQSQVVQLQKSKRAQLIKERLADDPICCLPDLGLVIRKQGLDEKIDGLGLFSQIELLSDVLEDQLGFDKGSIDNAKIKILGHRPGKRCIGRINFQHIQHGNSEENSLFVKLYKTGSHTGLYVHQLTENLYQNGFSSHHPFRIAKPLGFNQQYNLLLMEHAAGNILTEMPDSDHENALFRTGQAIHQFHSTKSAVTKTFSTDDELKILNHWVPLTASVYPELNDSLFKALNLIKTQLDAIKPKEFTLVHRDFYEKQILFTEDSSTLIDFDTACMADPAIDLGNFIAHLQLLNLQGISLPVDAEMCFVKGYGSENTAALRHRVMIYKCSTLLRLVCIYSFWPQYQLIPEQLLQLFFENY